MNDIKDPVISIDQDSKSYAIFDGLTMIKPFEPYTTVDQAKLDADAWLAPHLEPDQPVRLVWPNIRSMRKS